MAPLSTQSLHVQTPQLRAEGPVKPMGRPPLVRNGSTLDKLEVIIDAPFGSKAASRKLLAKGGRANPRSPVLFTKLCSYDALDSRIKYPSSPDDIVINHSTAQMIPVECHGSAALMTPPTAIAPAPAVKAKSLAPPKVSSTQSSPALSTVCGSDVSELEEPLPSDSPAIDLSSPDAQKAHELAEEAFASTLKWMEETDWKKCGTKQGVVCERKDLKKQPAICRGSIYFDKEWEPEAILEWVWECDNIIRFDNTLEKAYRVATWSDEWPGLCAYFQAFKGQFSFPGREFMLVGGRKRISKDHCLSIARTAPFDHLLPAKTGAEKTVRANLMLCGMDCRRMEDGRVRLSIVSQVDVNEKWAPEWILNHIYIEQLTKLSKIHATIMKDNKARNRRGSCQF